jgi:hypothetical protein
MRQPIPLTRRPFDIALLAFFAFNLVFVTYVISLEQIVLDDPLHYAPPVWPPEALLRIIHWYERSFDPLLLARPAWYRATIWIDVLFFGPFYAAAVYAYARGRDWIRVPSLVWAGMMFSNVFIILHEERLGLHAAPSFAAVALSNGAWLVVPLVVVWRMARSEHPFTEAAA